MGPRATLGVVISFGMLVACGGGDGAPSTYQDPASDQNATEPAAPVSGSTSGTEPEKARGAENGADLPSVLHASPACAAVGGRVVLKLGWTRDRRAVTCHDARDVSVRFAPNENAKITAMGMMSDGFCGIDVEVPKEAESGKVRVEVGDDVFETENAFAIPCR